MEQNQELSATYFMSFNNLVLFSAVFKIAQKLVTLQKNLVLHSWQNDRRRMLVFVMMMVTID